MLKLWKDRLLTLGDEGSDGGSGGGDPTPPSQPDFGEAPPRNPRQAIYDKMDADSAPAEGTPTKETPPPTQGAAPPAEPKPDSAPTPPTAEQIEEKRIEDTQRAYHQSQEELKAEREKNAKLQAQIDLAAKYVDFDKLTEHDKREVLKRLEQPVTVKDLEDLKKDLTSKSSPPETPAPDGGLPVNPEDRKAYLEKYLNENPHLIPYAKSGELGGVAVAIARANPELSVEEVGKRASQYFKDRDDQIRRKTEEDLTARKEALGGAGAPRAAQPFPETPAEEGPIDTSAAAEVSSRHERLRRQRQLI